MLGGDKIQIWLLKLEKRRSKLESPENLLLFQLTTVQWKILYSRVRNKHTPMFINFLTFFQGLQPYSGLHRANLSNISTYKVLMGLLLFFLPNFPGAMFIQGATFIPDSRVREEKWLFWDLFSGKTWMTHKRSNA